MLKCLESALTSSRTLSWNLASKAHQKATNVMVTAPVAAFGPSTLEKALWADKGKVKAQFSGIHAPQALRLHRQSGSCRRAARS